MVMEFVEYLIVMGLSAFKVMLGAFAAINFDMSILEIFLTVAIGGTIGIVLYAYLGNEIRSFFARRSRSKGIVLPTASRIKRLRMIIRIWKKFGIVGIAFLTPPLLTPPIGTAIALAFGERSSKIVLYLGTSMVAWSLVFAFFGEKIAALIH